MKKILALLVALVMVSALCAGCTKKADEQPSDTSASENTESVDESKEDDTTASEETSAEEDPSDEETSSEEVVTEGTLQDFYNAFLALQSDPEALVFFESNHYFDRLYAGLSDISLKQSALYCPPVTGNACEIAMVEVADAKDIDAVKAIFQKRIEEGASGACDAEVADAWAQRAEIQESGNFVAMVVLPRTATMPENIFLGK